MSDPPFTNQCGAYLSGRKPHELLSFGTATDRDVVDECELPLVDVGSLWSGGGDRGQRGRCVAAIADASSEWGFFQVLNHGISKELFGEMRREQKKLFELPFEKKSTSRIMLHESYRWGAPCATSLHQFSWSEAFHIPLSVASEDNDICHHDEFSSLRFAKAMAELVQMLAEVLAENLGQPCSFLAESCSKETCFLRLNRYPPCPYSPEIFGLTPHTDSDFLTILWQDQVGGLQLMKNSKWVAVRPNPDALIVNIGDLFQAWSNDTYKSVKHKVMTNSKLERYSIAYFLCPSYKSIIGSCKEPSIYKKFTFGEYRKQVQEDVKKSGNKVGLPRFLL